MAVSLFLRKSGIWYLKISNLGKITWKSTGTKDRKAARACLLQYSQQQVTTKSSVSKNSDRSALTLSEFTAECMRWSLTNHRKSTTVMFRATLANFRRIVGDLPITDITLRNVDQFKAKRLTEVNSTSVNIELRTLRSALHQAKKWGLISEVPITGKNLLKVPSDTIALSESEVKQLLDSIQEPWLRSIVLVAVYTGLRRNELCRLTWSDFDESRGLLTVHESKAGKARCIPLSEGVTQILVSIPKTSDRIFTLDGKQPVQGSWVSHLFKRYCRKLGFSEKIHFHTLRHTCASIMVRNGVSLFHASKVLGHSSVVVTEKFYAHMGVEDLRSAVNVVGQLLQSNHRNGNRLVA